MFLPMISAIRKITVNNIVQELKNYPNETALIKNSELYIAKCYDKTGHTAEEVHEALKQRFCPVRVVRLGDSEHRIRSTAKLSTPEFGDYIEQVVAFAATELGVSVPAPGEYA